MQSPSSMLKYPPIEISQIVLSATQRQVWNGIYQTLRCVPPLLPVEDNVDAHELLLVERELSYILNLEPQLHEILK